MKKSSSVSNKQSVNSSAFRRLLSRPQAIFPVLFALILGSVGTYTLSQSHALTAVNPPTGVTVSVTSPTTTQVVWWPSTSTPAPGYSVYRDNVEVGIVNSWLSLDGRISFSDSNLTPGTSYTYYVQAHSDAGTANSLPVTVTTQQSPTASQVGIVTGTVTGPRKAPVPNALVSIFYFGATHDYRTDANGTFTISGVPAGSYSLSTSASGYKPTSSRVNVVGGQSVSIQISLKVTR